MTKSIEQAIYGGHDSGGYRFLARSPGFREDWFDEAQRLCTGFGERPAGVTCPLAVFALPFAGDRVAVVQVADQGRDDAGRPGALAFRLLILPRRLYSDLGGDPFHVADQYPAAWEDRGELPTLEWTAGPPPHRAIEQICDILNVPECPTLLGCVQALLDGGKVAFARLQPDTQLLRNIWALLPTEARGEFWPASFAFENTHNFHAVVTPRLDVPGFENHVHEEHAGDYPEGRYERALQVAAEDRSQAELDALFSRRSRSHMIRLGLLLLAAFLLASLFLPRFSPPPTSGKQTTATAKELKPEKREGEAVEPLRLPPADAFPRLRGEERQRLAEDLRHLGARLQLDLPDGDSERDLDEALTRLDRKLELLTTATPRDVKGALGEGPPARRLRALLYKYGAADHDDLRLTTPELVERLEKHLGKVGLIKEGKK